METSQKEESILTLFKELTKREENVLTMYFGMGGKSKTTLLEMGQDFDMIEEDVIQIKNDGIRKFIKLIVSTGILGVKEDSFVLLQMELEKSISRVSHFLIVQLRCNFNRIFT